MEWLNAIAAWIPDREHGCGRCITWCPAGIDITAEVAALRKGTIA